MTFDRLARDDFERAVSKGFFARVLRFLRGQSHDLLPFDEVRQRLPMQGQHYLGNVQVPIKHIIGSQGRYRDFDRAFLPLHGRTKDRWVSVDRAHLEQVSLPPVELYKIGEAYFVKDGNHRVSVARERGQEFIDAFVTEIYVPVALTPETRIDDLALKEKQARFLDQTGLHRSHPEAQFDSPVLETYDELLEHISVHRWYLGEKLGRQPTFEEAGASWYEQVYAPLLRAMREQGLVKALPKVAETDLYLWLAKYQWYLRMAYQQEEEAVPPAAPAEPVSGEAAAASAAHQQALRQLAQTEDNPPQVRRLVNVLRKASWVEEMVLEEDRAAFLARTQLPALRPQAEIRLTTPGQYRRLLEHIDVHRWYLGEQRGAEASYEEAVISWFDNVYLPLVEMVREQDLLAHFPGRLEGDLYLWLVNRQEELKQVYSAGD